MTLDSFADILFLPVADVPALTILVLFLVYKWMDRD